MSKRELPFQNESKAIKMAKHETPKDKMTSAHQTIDQPDEGEQNGAQIETSRDKKGGKSGKVRNVQNWVAEEDEIILREFLR